MIRILSACLFFPTLSVGAASPLTVLTQEPFVRYEKEFFGP